MGGLASQALLDSRPFSAQGQRFKFSKKIIIKRREKEKVREGGREGGEREEGRRNSSSS